MRTVVPNAEDDDQADQKDDETDCDIDEVGLDDRPDADVEGPIEAADPSTTGALSVARSPGHR